MDVRRELEPAQCARPAALLLAAPVQTDKTIESLRELQKELGQFVGDRPATSRKSRRSATRTCALRPLRDQRCGERAIGEMIVYERPDDYVRTLKTRIEAQTDDGVRAAARAPRWPTVLTWVIVGDLKKIEEPIRELKLGDVTVLDKDGKQIR